MTRRVRFTPFLRAGTFAAATLAAGWSHASDVPLAAQPPIATGVGVAELAAADVDGDGDADVVAAHDNAIHWYERSGGSWTQRTIQAFATTAEAVSVAVADVDGDGDVDALSSVFQADSVFWHENTAGDGSAWALHTVLTTAVDVRDASFGDLDGDGDLDILAGSVGRVAWFENTGDPSVWPARTVMTTLAQPQSHVVEAADVDGDGDLDVVSGGFGGPYFTAWLHWAENTSGNGTSWTTRLVFSQAYSTPGSVAVEDINGDGDLDIVFGHSGPVVRWFENASGNGTSWTAQTIPIVQGGVDPATADLDGDGDLDILVAVNGTGFDHTFWLENTAGNGTAWTRRTITAGEAGPRALAAADLDGDGDRDVVLGTSVSDRLLWFRNESIHRSACFAPRAALSTASAGAISVSAADVDGDGALDVVAASIDDDAVRWHDNAAGDGSLWVTQTISTAADGAVSVTAADVDGDGDEDVLSASVSDDKVAWYENVGGSGTSWTTRTITTAADSALAVGAADVDGDGDVDAVSAGYYSGIRWYANTAGNGTAWTTATIVGGAFLAGAVADVDGDGDLDAASSTAFFDPFVRWHDNAAGNGSAWSLRTVTSLSPNPSYGLAASDLDGDGDTDLVGAFSGTPPNGVRWFKNLDGAGGSWSTATISPDSALSVAVGDLDGDGDLDALSSGFGALALRWHENGGGAAAWTQRTLATAASECWGVAAADLDGDGDLDVVAATPGADRIDWFANQGGQFSLAVTDTAPPGAPNAELVSMLRVVVTHGGRAGDGSLELASLGLLFEEGAGDPLTTAEANAVIESLRVYADANGSGVFEPGTDVLVTSVPTLTLAAGVQAIPLADGDPNVEVAFGTPRTFFVVTELTADASTQVPNHFRVTLLGLGPSATTAEDRTYDLALAPGCPANVASTVMGATPVTLMRFSVE